AVADFSTDAQTLLVIARRLREVTLPMRNRAQSVERSGGGLPVANGLRELQRLAQEMASCDQIAYVPHRTRQKTQGAGERALVVRLPSDRDSFLEELARSDKAGGTLLTPQEDPHPAERLGPTLWRSRLTGAREQPCQVLATFDTTTAIEPERPHS